MESQHACLTNCSLVDSNAPETNLVEKHFFPAAVVRKTPEMKTPRGILAMTGADVTVDCWMSITGKNVLRGARLCMAAY